MNLVRILLITSFVSLFSVPSAGFAAQEETFSSSAAQLPRIGFLFTGARTAATLTPYLDRLEELGYFNLGNVYLDWRFSESDSSSIPMLAEELVEWGADVIITNSTVATLGAMEVTTTIPIVFAGSTDPVGSSLVGSLEQPNGNVTGMSFIGEPSDMRLRILHELLPDISRVAVIGMPTVSQQSPSLIALHETAEELGIELQYFRGENADDLEQAMSAGADAGLVLAQPQTANLASEIIRRAEEAQLPVIYQGRAQVAAGGLIGYGANADAQQRLVIDYVDAILHGTPVSELPVHEAEHFDFAVNLQTAAALGIEIPTAMLEQATEVLA